MYISPERINTGNKGHRLKNIVKIASDIDEETLDIVATVYEIVMRTSVYIVERQRTVKIKNKKLTQYR